MQNADPQYFHAFELTLNQPNIISKLIENNRYTLVEVIIGEPLKALGLNKRETFSISKDYIHDLQTLFAFYYNKDNTCLALNIELPRIESINNIIISIQPCIR